MRSILRNIFALCTAAAVVAGFVSPTHVVAQTHRSNSELDYSFNNLDVSGDHRRGPILLKVNCVNILKLSDVHFKLSNSYTEATDIPAYWQAHLGSSPATQLPASAKPASKPSRPTLAIAAGSKASAKVINVDAVTDRYNELLDQYNKVIAEISVRTGLGMIEAAENDYLVAVGELEAILRKNAGDSECVISESDVATLSAAVNDSDTAINGVLTKSADWPNMMTLQDWDARARAISTVLGDMKHMPGYSLWYETHAYPVNLLSNQASALVTLVKNLGDSPSAAAEYAERVAVLKQIDVALKPYVKNKDLLKQVDVSTFVDCPNSQGRAKAIVASIVGTAVYSSPVTTGAQTSASVEASALPEADKAGGKPSAPPKPVSSAAITPKPTSSAAIFARDVATVECPSSVIATYGVGQAFSESDHFTIYQTSQSTSGTGTSGRIVDTSEVAHQHLLIAYLGNYAFARSGSTDFVLAAGPIIDFGVSKTSPSLFYGLGAGLDRGVYLHIGFAVVNSSQPAGGFSLGEPVPSAVTSLPARVVWKTALAGFVSFPVGGKAPVPSAAPSIKPAADSSATPVLK